MLSPWPFLITSMYCFAFIIMYYLSIMARVLLIYFDVMLVRLTLANKGNLLTYYIVIGPGFLGDFLPVWHRLASVWKMTIEWRASDKHADSFRSKQAAVLTVPYSVSQKLCKIVFTRTSTNFDNQIFGTRIARRIGLCELHLFSTSPNSCQRLTMLNVDVPNCYITV